MAKAKDTRLGAIKELVHSGTITSLKAIFDIMPLTAVSTLSGIHYSTLYKKVNNPGLFKTDEQIILAELFGISVHQFLTLQLNDMKYKPPKE